MAKPIVKAVLLSPQRELGTKPLLVVGPSLGTSTILWTET
ncbi:alpha/beta hydrolase, partial [Paenarthrobacter sp. CM16]|nr:alpha/beta hydrolase [Paenarthrobacter sp. CM16]